MAIDIKDDSGKVLATIGNEEESYWDEVVNNTKKDIDNLEKLLKFQTEVLKMAIAKREEAKDEEPSEV